MPAPKQPKGFKLPRGYSLDPPADMQGITVDGNSLYGGATISDEHDAGGHHFILCCATGPGEPPFRLRGFRCPAGSTKYAETALAIEPAGAIITGRGHCDIQFIDGNLHFSGWRDKEFFTGTIPAFVPFPSIPALERRIAALEARVAAVTSKAGHIEVLMHQVEEEGVRTKWAVQALSTRVDSIDAGALTDEELARLRVVRGG